MKVLKYFILMTSVLLIGFSLGAQETDSSSSSNVIPVNVPVPEEAPPPIEETATAPTSDPVPAVTESNPMDQSQLQDIGVNAGKQKDKNNLLGIVNGVMGVGFGAICAIPSGGTWACPIAAGLGIQVVQNAVNSSNSSSVANGVTYGGEVFDQELQNLLNESGNQLAELNNTLGNQTPSPTGDSTLGSLQNTLDEITSTIGEKGVTLNPDGTVTTPSGTFNASDFASAQSMADAGIIGKGMIGAVQAKMDAIKKKAYNKGKVIAMGLRSGGGGSRGAARAPANYQGTDFASLFGKKGSRNANAPKRKGLSRMVAGGEAIGVRTDNIFDMIQRKYKNLKGQQQFIAK